jgi:hypothetical protein
MDDRDRQEKSEERQEPSEAPERIEDLDVPEGESEDVKGGYYSFKQAWPKKYSG